MMRVQWPAIPPAKKTPATPVGRPAPYRLHTGPARDTVKFSGGPPPTDDPDFMRWHDILKDMARQDLSQFKSPQEFEVTQDGKSVKIPKDYIDLPRFMKGANNDGAGQGQGQEGDQVGQVGQNGQPQPAQQGQQPGEPGDEEGEGDEAGEGASEDKEDPFEFTISRNEIAQWIGKDLELPNFQPRGTNFIQKMETFWDTLSRVGTPGNIHRRKTLLEVLKRNLSNTMQNFNPAKLNWQKSDFRYISDTERPIPKENAVIFYLIDTSGSMDEERRTMARGLNFYMDTFILAEYGKINAQLRKEIPKEDDFGDGVVRKFYGHDSEASEVSEQDFYTTKKGGGTNYAPAFQKIKEEIEKNYPLDQWNVYIVHYTDGDPAGDDDKKKAMATLQELLGNGLNMYAYVETKAHSKTNSFKKSLTDAFGEKHQYVRMTSLDAASQNDYLQSLQDVLGKSRNKKK